MHIWQGCGVVIKNRERKRGNDISSRRNEIGGMKENLFLSSFVDYDIWNVDYRELIGFSDLTTHLNCYMRFIFDITIRTLLTIVFRNGKVDAESIRIRFELNLLATGWHFDLDSTLVKTKFFTTLSIA